MSGPPNSHTCCGDYTRSQLLRSAAAEAGKGLPTIEPGMPTPAGTGLSRRTFLSRSAGLALAVYGASKIPLSAFETGIAQAAPTDKVLVSIFFDGGIDSLSVLAPVGDSRYAQLRPNLALSPEAGTAFSEDPRLRWHPAAASLATLHAEKKVSAFPAIGYDDPDQSHFTSRHFYEVGELAVGHRTGWLGRYIDSVGDDENPLQGLSMDGSLSPMIATADRPVAAIDSVDGYDLWSAVSDPVREEMYRSFARFGSLPSDSAGLAQVRRATAQTDKLRQDLGGIGDFTSLVTYPDTYFAHKLAGLAAFIAAGLPMRVVTVRAAGGYDTHADQAADLDRNLRETCEAVLAFQRRPRSTRPRRPRDDRDVERVRPPAGGERLGRHRPWCRRLRLRDRLQSQRRDGRRIPRPGKTRLQRQPARDQRLPRDVLLAARAVARPRCGSDHPRRGGLRTAGAGESMRRVAVAALPLALVAFLGLASVPSGAAGADPSITDCTWQRHSKRVVKRVKRHGKPRRVVRVKRWWTCNPLAPASILAPPTDPEPAPAPEPEPETGPARLSVKALEFSFTLSRPSLPAGEAIVELNNQGEDPHNLNLQLEGGGEPPLEISEAGPLEHRTAKFDLAAGSYRLWCSLPQHDEWGMNATLLVSGG